MIIKCENCGIEFYRKPSHIKKHIHNFCSKKCSDIGKLNKLLYPKNPLNGIKKGSDFKRRKRIKIKCDHCKKEIEKVPSMLYKHNFCNQRCKASWQKENLIGTHNPFYGKTHKGDALKKISKTWFKEGIIPPNKGIKARFKVRCYVCKKEFETDRSHFTKSKGRFFCSRKCWSNQGKIVSCTFCGKKIIRRESELKYSEGDLKQKGIHHKEVQHIFCSTDCHSKWVSKTGFISGEKNPMFGKVGPLHPNWKGPHAKSFRPYTFDFNKYFKEKIKKRDDYCCQLCHIGIEDIHQLNRYLVIHHIDYNKLNSFPQNCITLCNKCHTITNYNRGHWKTFFQSLLKELYQYEYTEDQKIILYFDKKPEDRG